jgi:hypothetical protein
MSRLRLSAASVALTGLPLVLSAAFADEKAAGPDSVVVAGAESTHWAAYADDDNSLLMQARAVFADLRVKHGIPAEPPTVSRNVQVVSMRDEPGQHLRTGNGSEGCKFMEIPGSRIREWRCYYPNEGEKALNAYQFREEIRQNVRQTLIQDMNRTSNQIFIQETMQNPSMFGSPRQ